jgi:mandelamide amidase
VRVPAALCGICGFRPTTGRYPTAGTAPITPLFDQIGSHARGVQDLILFDQMMTGQARAPAPGRLKGLRLGIARDYYFEGIDSAVARVVEAALERLRAAGATIVEAPLPGMAALVSQVTGPVQLHDAGPALTAYLRESGSAVTLEALVAQASPDIRGLLSRFALPGAAGAISEAAYRAAADVHRPAMQRRLADWFATNRVSAMLMPATMTTAPPIGQADTVEIDGRRVAFQQAVARNISPGSTAGLPGLVLPAGLTPAGLRAAIELDGPAGSDRALLAIGLAVERALGPIPAPKIG